MRQCCCSARFTPVLFRVLGVRDDVFAALTLLLARSVAMMLAIAGARMTRREKLMAGWFGPKGFASVFFGLLILRSGLPNGAAVFSLLAVAVVLSDVAHSSTDVMISRRFERHAAAQ